MIYALLGIAVAFCAYIQWGDEIPILHIDKDMTKKEAKYVHKVNMENRNLDRKSVV